MRKSFKTILIAGYCLVLVAFLVWAFVFDGFRSITVIESGESQVQVFSMVPAIQENRLLMLDYPAVIHAGEGDTVRLTFDLDEGITGGSGPGGSLANVYGTHNILAEARLEIPGMDIRPQAAISEALLPGQKITFYWSLLPAEPGKYQGTAWFYLRFLPMQGGEEQRLTLSAQPIEINVTTLMGIRAELAGWIGIGGTLLGIFLVFPYILDAFRQLGEQVKRNM